MSGSSQCPQQTLTDRTKIHNDALELLANLKPYPKPAPGTSGRPVRVRTNAYQVIMPRRVIYRYDVTMSAVAGPRNVEVELSKKSESFFVIADRTNVCREAFRLMFAENRDFFGKDPHQVFYDLQSTLYCLQRLPLAGGQKEMRLTLNVPDLKHERGEEGVPTALRNLTVLNMLIKMAKSNEIDMDDLNSIHDPETGVRNRSVLTILEMIVNQYPLFNEQHFLTVRGSTSYYMNGAEFGAPEIALDGSQRMDFCTKYLAAGVKKSGAFIQGDPKHFPEGKAAALLMESKRSPFHCAGISLIDYIQRSSTLAQHYNAFLQGRCSDGQRTQIVRALRKILFIPYNRARPLEINNILNVDATNHACQTAEGEMSLAMYYQRKWNQRLQFPQAHLVGIKQKGAQVVYPAEFMFVADNQTVMVDQMDAKDKATMIKNAAIRPDEVERETGRGAQAIALHESEFIKASGIKVQKQAMEVTARKLDDPKFEYANGRISEFDKRNVRGPDDAYEASWRQLPYVIPVQNERYCIYLLGTESDQAPQINENDMKMYMRHLDECARSYGMTLGTCADSAWICDYEVDDKVRMAAEHNVPLVFFVSPSYIKKAHDAMKNAEHKYRTVVTQDLKHTTLQKVIQRGSSTLENIIGKTNVKLGGVNYSIRVTNPDVQRELDQTLFIGIGLNQPGAKSRADRAQAVRNSLDEKPGVLGFCGNICEHKDTFAGDFVYINAYRSEVYQALEFVAKKCVRDFRENRGHAPKRVVFFYAGIAEGQYENVLKLSVPLIRHGLAEGNGGLNLPLCLITVQKENNINMFPLKYPKGANLKDSAYNVQPGTVIDTGLVHPLYADFYLTAHTALKGHAHSPRFTILVNEPNLSMDVVENFTFALCYDHQIVGKPTALPTPLVVAEAYAMRGRRIFMAAQVEEQKGTYQLPRRADGGLDLFQLTDDLSYENCPALRKKRVNA